MKNLSRGLLLSLAIVFAVSNAISQKSTGKKVLVTIGDEKVTASEFTKVYEFEHI